MDTTTIDLRVCKKGDTLVSQNGDKFEYVSFQEKQEYPHLIIGEDGRKGSRLHNGQVCVNVMQRGEYDIVQIVPKGKRTRRAKA